MFPTHAAFNIPANFNVGGGIALGAPASDSDQVPQLIQVQQAIAYALSTISAKPSCKCAATASVNLAANAAGSYDGITVDVGDRILLWQQTNVGQNGTYKIIYNVFAGANRLVRSIRKAHDH